MANRAFDFLTESILLDPRRQSDDFAGESDEDLRRHLAEYRAHVLSSLEDILGEAQGDGALSVLAETRQERLPPERLLLQSALYLDRLVVPDPVFRLTTPRDVVREDIAERIIGERASFPRRELVRACRYMRDSTPFVAGGYLKYIPSSLATEPPTPIPFTYSPSQFSDVIPPAALHWLRDRAQVRAVRLEGETSIITGHPPDATTDAIWVNFDDPGSAYGWHYAHHQIEVFETDEETRTATLSMTRAPPASPEGRRAWVDQSINKAANELYLDTSRDVTLAARLGSMLMTTSPLVADLLGTHVGTEEHGVELRAAQAVMDLELPVLENVDPVRLMDLRHRESKALHAFRVALETRVRELSSVDDPVERKAQLANLAHALSREDVAAVEARLQAAKRTATAGAALGIAQLGLVLHATVPTLLVCLVAFAHGLAGWKEIRNAAQAPGYLLWRLTRKQG